MNISRKTRYVAFCFLWLFLACGSATPENYFDQAVLNSNLYADFGGRQVSAWLAQPAQKYNSDKRVMEASSYVEAFEFKMTYVKEAYEKMKKLKATDDTREMLEASEAVFSFVMEKYKNDYLRIAAMKDKGESQEAIQQAVQEFDEKNAGEFAQRFGKLIGLGTAYAKRHGIRLSTR